MLPSTLAYVRNVFATLVNLRHGCWRLTSSRDEDVTDVFAVLVTAMIINRRRAVRVHVHTAVSAARHVNVNPIPAHFHWAMRVLSVGGARVVVVSAVSERLVL